MERHVSYLVRFWWAGPDQDRRWRALAREVRGEAQWSFRTVEGLFDFLREELIQQEHTGVEPDSPTRSGREQLGDDTGGRNELRNHGV